MDLNYLSLCKVKLKELLRIPDQAVRQMWTQNLFLIPGRTLRILLDSLALLIKLLIAELRTLWLFRYFYL